jgi:hypothetical protein
MSELMGYQIPGAQDPGSGTMTVTHTHALPCPVRMPGGGAHVQSILAKKPYLRNSWLLTLPGYS